MKSFVLIIIGFIAGYWIKGSASNFEVTYNDKGTKTVVASCDNKRDCLISIGKQCEAAGYSIVKIDILEQNKEVITAECGKEPQRSLFGILAK